MQQKHCRKCSRDLPIHCFSRDKSRSDGLSRRCRSCDAARREAYRKANADLERERDRLQSERKKAKRAAQPKSEWHLARERTAALFAKGLKKCTKCKEVFPLDRFYQCRTENNGLDTRCKSCAHGRWKILYRKNESLRQRAAARQALAYQHRRDSIVRRRKEGRDNLSDLYVRSLLVDRCPEMPRSVPPELIALKREQLKITRYLKDIKDEQHP